MRDVPDELWEIVHEIVFSLAKASEADDQSLRDSFYEKLRAFFEERQEAGLADPFVTETLANFTTDPAEAVALYQLALKQSAGFPGERLSTKRISMARSLVELGQIAAAKEQMSLARKEPDYDADAVAKIEALLHNITLS